MAYVLFHEAGLMETFHVPQREFINYFRALEANYGSNVCKYTHSHTCMHTHHTYMHNPFQFCCTKHLVYFIACTWRVLMGLFGYMYTVYSVVLYFFSFRSQ